MNSQIQIADFKIITLFYRNCEKEISNKFDFKIFQIKQNLKLHQKEYNILTDILWINTMFVSIKCSFSYLELQNIKCSYTESN